MYVCSTTSLWLWLLTFSVFVACSMMLTDSPSLPSNGQLVFQKVDQLPWEVLVGIALASPLPHHAYWYLQPYVYLWWFEFSVSVFYGLPRICVLGCLAQAQGWLAKNNMYSLICMSSSYMYCMLTCPSVGNLNMLVHSLLSAIILFTRWPAMCLSIGCVGVPAGVANRSRTLTSAGNSEL